MNQSVRVVRAPGRVNLIGEHTDYSGGFVMPAAIQLATIVTFTPNSSRQLVVHSEGLVETATLDLAEPLRPGGGWSDYVAGVVWVLSQEGYTIAGGEMSIASTVPRGAGLSSSAALEVAAAFAMLGHAAHQIDRLTLATWCQRAENESARGAASWANTSPASAPRIPHC